MISICTGNSHDSPSHPFQALCPSVFASIQLHNVVIQLGCYCDPQLCRRHQGSCQWAKRMEAAYDTCTRAFASLQVPKPPLMQQKFACAMLPHTGIKIAFVQTNRHVAGKPQKLHQMLNGQ